jgi:capsular exopolysaccharide synthesis family protein
MNNSQTDSAEVPGQSHVPVPARELAHELAPVSENLHSRPALAIRDLPPPGLSTTISLPLLLKALQRRWFRATVAGLLAAVVATTVMWFVVPKKYVATASLMINPSTPAVAFVQLARETDAGSYQRTQGALVKSRFVLTAALRPSKIAELSIVREQDDAIAWLQKALTVDFQLSNEIMRLQIQGDRPQELRDLLTSIVESYMEEVVMGDKKDRNERLDALRSQAVNFEDRLRTKRRTLKDLSDLTGSTSPFVVAMNQQYQLAQLNEKQRDLMQIEKEMNRARLEAISEDAKGSSPQPVNPLLVNKAVESDKSVQKLDLDIADAQERLDKVVAKVGKDSPLVAELTKKVESLTYARANLIDKKRPTLEKEESQRQQLQAKDQSRTLKEKLALMQEMHKILTTDIDKLRNEMRSTQQGAGNLEAAKDDVDQVEGTTRKLRDLVAQFEVEQASPARVRVWDRADVQLATTTQTQILMSGGGGIAAMAIVILLIGYWELMAKRVISGDDVVSGLGWRLIGALPALPDRARKGFVRSGKDDKYWHSLLTESVDATRTMLLHAARTEGLRSVMVTSAVAGEGKTSLSCHLATSLARAGRKTVLIDCDLRSPAAHRLFELPSEPGMCELLRHEIDLADALRPTPAANLWFIPAGRVNSQTLQALALEGVAPVLDELKKQFDFLVIDSSPVLPVVDALVIGQQVDVVIFSLLRNISRIPNVYAAYQRLSTLGIRMLGAVVNGVQKEMYGYSYRYYSRQPEE